MDGVAAPNEPIDIIINNWGQGGKYSKSYVTDVNGEVKFSIPPAAQDLPNYRIQVSQNSSQLIINFVIKSKFVFVSVVCIMYILCICIFYGFLGSSYRL